MEQYFENNPLSRDKEFTFEYFIFDKKFKFWSNNGVFSKKAVDFGTNLMLQIFIQNETKAINFKEILDAGCGLGVVGTVLGKFFKDTKITMFDINNRAVDLSLKNLNENGITNAKVLCSDLFEHICGSFDYILSNPPIRAGKAIVFKLYEGAFEKLNIGGALYVVIQKKQGAESSEKKLKEIFGNCETLEKSGGFRILRCIK